MRTIWKFPLPQPLNTVSMPVGAQLKLVGIDPATAAPAVWAIVDPVAEREDRMFGILGTGADIPPGCDHLGSFIAAPFVWHLFEIHMAPAGKVEHADV